MRAADRRDPHTPVFFPGQSNYVTLKMLSAVCGVIHCTFSTRNSRTHPEQFCARSAENNGWGYEVRFRFPIRFSPVTFRRHFRQVGVAYLIGESRYIMQDNMPLSHIFLNGNLLRVFYTVDSTAVGEQLCLGELFSPESWVIQDAINDNCL